MPMDDRLILYGSEAEPPVLPAPAPAAVAPHPATHLRWHPLRGEWVAYASHRQNRTFLPPPEYNPLLPSDDPASPTEVPAGRWDMAVFENLFPTLSRNAKERMSSRSVSLWTFSSSLSVSKSPTMTSVALLVM